MAFARSLSECTRLGILAGALLGSGCAWINLSWGALTYPTTQSGEAANVAVHGDHAYITRGAAGIEIVSLRGNARPRLMTLPAMLGSADDVAVADHWLLVLDAQPPGALALFSLREPGAPVLRGTPVPTAVGPFSGVSAADGNVVVSGGTGELSLRSFDEHGLGPVRALADFGRGQPDVLLASGGLIFVSTHTFGPHFELALARANAAGLQRLAAVGFDTFGFTPGGAKPANFPLESAIDGETLYVASAAGLTIVDLADPTTPRILAQLPLPVQAVNVDVRAGLAAVVGSEPSPQLVLIDVRTPAQPQILQSFPLPEGSRATGVALTASHAVIAAHGRGVLLLARANGIWEQAGPAVLVDPSLNPKESKS